MSATAAPAMGKYEGHVPPSLQALVRFTPTTSQNGPDVHSTDGFFATAVLQSTLVDGHEHLAGVRYTAEGSFEQVQGCQAFPPPMNAASCMCVCLVPHARQSIEGQIRGQEVHVAPEQVSECSI